MLLTKLYFKEVEAMSNLIQKAFFIALLVAFFLFLCGAETRAAEQPVVKIRLVTTMPVGTTVTKAGDMLARLIEERGRGRFKVDHFPAGQLYDTSNVVEAVPTGALEIAFLQSAVSKIVPEYDLLNTEFILGNADEVYRARDATRQSMGKAFGKLKAQLLGWVNYGTGLAYAFHKPVNKLEDFKGLKMRSPGGTHSIVTQALGAAPVSMSSADVYLALQRKTVDSVMSGYESILTRKWYEVARYGSGWYSGPHLYAVVANLAFWNRLTPEEHEMISKAVLEVQAWSDQNAVDEGSRVIQKLRDKGMIFTNISDQEHTRMKNAAAKAVFAYFSEVMEKNELDSMVNEIETAIGRRLFPR
jgi:TRAP-type C4-dicarboxylate transport system substrate-binding protein